MKYLVCSYCGVYVGWTEFEIIGISPEQTACLTIFITFFRQIGQALYSLAGYTAVIVLQNTQ